MIYVDWDITLAQDWVTFVDNGVGLRTKMDNFSSQGTENYMSACFGDHGFSKYCSLILQNVSSV